MKRASVLRRRDQWKCFFIDQLHSCCHLFTWNLILCQSVSLINYQQLKTITSLVYQDLVLYKLAQIVNSSKQRGKSLTQNFQLKQRLFQISSNICFSIQIKQFSIFFSLGEFLLVSFPLQNSSSLQHFLFIIYL